METKVIKKQKNGKLIVELTYTVTETVKVEVDSIDGELTYESVEKRDNCSLDQKWTAIELAWNLSS